MSCLLNLPHLCFTSDWYRFCITIWSSVKLCCYSHSYSLIPLLWIKLYIKFHYLESNIRYVDKNVHVSVQHLVTISLFADPSMALRMGLQHHSGFRGLDVRKGGVGGPCSLREGPFGGPPYFCRDTNEHLPSLDSVSHEPLYSDPTAKVEFKKVIII